MGKKEMGYMSDILLAVIFVVILFLIVEFFLRIL